MLPTLANLAVALMAALHVYILVLEMFLWTTPKGRKAFGLTPEFAEASRTLAANQGLYNGFLAAGLVWGLWLGPAGQGAKLFFLGCIIVAGGSCSSRPCRARSRWRWCWPRPGHDRADGDDAGRWAGASSSNREQAPAEK